MYRFQFQNLFLCKYNLSVGTVIAQTRRSMISDVPSHSSMDVHPSAGVQLDRIFLSSEHQLLIPLALEPLISKIYDYKFSIS